MSTTILRYSTSTEQAAQARREEGLRNQRIRNARVILDAAIARGSRCEADSLGCGVCQSRVNLDGSCRSPWDHADYTLEG